MVFIFSLGLCMVLAIGLLIVLNPDWITGHFTRRWENPYNHFKHY